MIAPNLGDGQAGSKRPGTRALKIFVADDLRDTVVSLVQLLRFEGHDVQGFYSGIDVVEAARNDKPDALICDIAMPGMSGFGVAQQIRATYGKQSPLLIACSGELTGQTDKMLGGLVGFDHYLLKPCDFRRILSLLEPLTLNSR